MLKGIVGITIDGKPVTVIAVDVDTPTKLESTNRVQTPFIILYFIVPVTVPLTPVNVPVNDPVFFYDEGRHWRDGPARATS